MYSIAEAANILGISEQLLRRYARNAHTGKGQPRFYAQKVGWAWVADDSTIARFRADRDNLKRKPKVSSVDIEGIKAAREAGDTIRAIAAKFNIDKSYVWMILSGKRTPKGE